MLNKWNQVFGSIKYHIQKISNEEVNFNDGFNKIKFISDDSVRLDKLIYFQTLTVVIRCVFKKGDLFYPQVSLDDALTLSIVKRDSKLYLMKKLMDITIKKKV